MKITNFSWLYTNPVISTFIKKGFYKEVVSKKIDFFIWFVVNWLSIACRGIMARQEWTSSNSQVQQLSILSVQRFQSEEAECCIYTWYSELVFIFEKWQGIKKPSKKLCVHPQQFPGYISEFLKTLHSV